MNPIVYTVGHSSHPVEHLVALLKRHRIGAIADVRSTPYSRRNPQYNRENLKASLKNEGIEYVFLGRQLGARSDDPTCYVDDTVQYDRLAATAPFREGLERVLQGFREHRLALMCAEQEPLHCHRTILVARELEKAGVAVEHILPDGEAEPHTQTMDRLVRQLGLPESDLFSNRADIHRAAYDRQAEKIAYRRKPGQGEPL